ncbi:unnamed protein product [Urochloa humidicola]
MHNTLRPTIAVFITNELLEHPDPNVKVVVTFYLTEVTRITAPEAHYDDDVIKVRFLAIVVIKLYVLTVTTCRWFQDVFKRIVDTFAELDDMYSPSFQRRVSILDSVARVPLLCRDVGSSLGPSDT